jgi:hypothetical protein
MSLHERVGAALRAGWLGCWCMLNSVARGVEPWGNWGLDPPNRQVFRHMLHVT